MDDIFLRATNSQLDEPVPKRHSVYYSNDEFVIVKVEDVLYRIPKGVLTSHSEFFKYMFSAEFGRSVAADNKEGSCDSNPIVFEQVLRADFDRLLSLIIDGKLNISVADSWCEKEWIPILHLADRWQMPKIRKKGLYSLKWKAPPHIQVSVGKIFEDKALIKFGLTCLCTRLESISESEGRVLGYATALKCATIREKLWIQYLTSEKYSSRPHIRRFVKFALMHVKTHIEASFSFDDMNIESESD